jgi:hypothetical protein
LIPRQQPLMSLSKLQCFFCTGIFILLYIHGSVLHNILSANTLNSSGKILLVAPLYSTYLKKLNHSFFKGKIPNQLCSLLHGIISLLLFFNLLDNRTRFLKHPNFIAKENQSLSPNIDIILSREKKNQFKVNKLYYHSYRFI